MSTARLPLRVCLWLASHPGESLTLAQIADKFDIDTRHAWASLEKSTIRNGLLSKEIKLTGDGTRYMLAHYSAGPALMELAK